MLCIYKTKKEPQIHLYGILYSILKLGLPTIYTLRLSNHWLGYAFRYLL